MQKVLVFLIGVLAFCGTASAWNCSDPLASRVDVGSAMPSGMAGDGDGQWYKGPDAQHPNDYYVCQVPSTTPPSGGSSNANSTATSASSSTANSASQSGASATGGQSTSSAVGNGGAVSGSGNSTNKITATGGAGGSATATGGSGGSSTSTATGGSQKQTQSVNNSGNSSASASNNGNGSNNSTYESNYTEPRQTPAAYAPTVIPAGYCGGSISMGASSPIAAVSFGKTKIDENCARLEAARQAPSIIARCKVYITDKYVKEAGVTLDECLASIPQGTVTVEQHMIQPPAAPIITVNVPPAVVTVIPAPVVASTPTVAQAAVIARAEKQHRAAHPNAKPCVTNDTIKP